MFSSAESGEDAMKDGSDKNHDISDGSAENDASARREFLRKCGKYAVLVPPAMALLFTRGANAGTPAAYKKKTPKPPVTK